MFKRDKELFLFDVLIAILKIEEVSKKFLNSQDLLYSFTDWDSIIREFEIIGEASKHLIKSNTLSKDYQEIVDFRNIIIHEYFGIDAEEVWDIIHDDLMYFKDVIVNLIKNIETQSKKLLVSSYKQDNKHLRFITDYLDKELKI